MNGTYPEHIRHGSTDLTTILLIVLIVAVFFLLIQLDSKRKRK